MGVQNREDLDTRPMILEELPSCKRIDKAVIAQDAGRTEDLLSRTLMAKIAATGKWVPFTDETATESIGIILKAWSYSPTYLTYGRSCRRFIASVGTEAMMPQLLTVKYGLMFNRKSPSNSSNESGLKNWSMQTYSSRLFPEISSFRRGSTPSGAVKVRGPICRP